MYVEVQVHSKLSAWFSIDHINSITAVPLSLSSVSGIYIQLQVSSSFALQECANIQTFISSLIMLFSFISTYPQTYYDDIFMFLHYSYSFIFNTLPFYFLIHLLSICILVVCHLFLMGPTFFWLFLILRYIHFDATSPHIY